jgi:hypothetical protein
MSFPPAITNLQHALTHAKAGNASKAMHHIGHAMIHLRGTTNNPGGVAKLPSSNSAPAKDMGQGGAPVMDNDADDPTVIDPNKVKAAPAVGSLRARLAGMGK